MQTLRRVPHLTVTWAHQPTLPGSDHHSPIMLSESQQGNHFNPTHPHNGQELDRVSSDNKTVPPGDTHALTFHPSVSLPVRFPDVSAAFSTLKTLSSDTWSGPNFSKDECLTSRCPDSQAPAPLKNSISNTRVAGEEFSTGMCNVGWTEMDFPPLGDFKGERRAETGIWVDKRIPKMESEAIRFV
jgi:hypothetical protein